MAEQELLGRASPFSQAWYTLVLLALSSWLLLHFLSKTHVSTEVKRGELLSAWVPGCRTMPAGPIKHIWP